MTSLQIVETALARSAALLRVARRPVALTGAGMSAESGIPTFRSSDTSLWSKWSPEVLATRRGFQEDKGLVWGWYVWRMAMIANAAPHRGHLALAEMASRWTEFVTITQNVDDLHERAGSRSVSHVHGRIDDLRCFACARPHWGFKLPADALSNPEMRRSPPHCQHCGGYVRPGVVWFGESLPTAPWRQAEVWVRQCDLLIVVGTSGVVQPAASLVSLALKSRAKVILIDPGDTDHSRMADVHWRSTAGEALPSLVAELARSIGSTALERS